MRALKDQILTDQWHVEMNGKANDGASACGAQRDDKTCHAFYSLCLRGGLSCKLLRFQVKKSVRWRRCVGKFNSHAKYVKHTHEGI